MGSQGVSESGVTLPGDLAHVGFDGDVVHPGDRVRFSMVASAVLADGMSRSMMVRAGDGNGGYRKRLVSVEALGGYVGIVDVDGDEFAVVDDDALFDVVISGGVASSASGQLAFDPSMAVRQIRDDSQVNAVRGLSLQLLGAFGI